MAIILGQKCPGCARPIPRVIRERAVAEQRDLRCRCGALQSWKSLPPEKESQAPPRPLSPQAVASPPQSPNSCGESTPIEIACPYCGCNAELVDSIAVYRKSYGMLWLCKPCQAWTGVHQDSKDHKPKGTLAKAALRQLRIQVHAAFDPIWQNQLEQEGGSKSCIRNGLYRKMAVELELSHDACHVGHFDEAMCRRALEVCAEWKKATPFPAPPLTKPPGESD